MKDTILQNWTIVRFIRLLIGIGIIVQAVVLQDLLLGAAGLLFGGMALFNAGCCGTAACATPARKPGKSINETSYEEVV